MVSPVHPPLRAVALGIAVVALVVAFVFLNSSGEGEGAERAAQPGAQGAEQGAGLSDASAQREAATDAAGSVARAGVLGTAGTNELGASSGGRRLHLVRAFSGAPVADATLRVWNPGSPEREVHERFDSARTTSQLRELLARDTQAIAVDSQGRALLPEASTWRVAVAEGAEGWGYRWLDPKGTDEIELELHPDFSLDVRVVNTAGRPVDGIRVVARVHASADNVWDLHGARTDAKGRARVEHVGWACSIWEVGASRPIRVELAGPLPEAVDFEFEPQAPPTGVIELVAPEGGALEVRAVDAEGRPVPGEFYVELALLREGDAAPDETELEGLPASATGRDGSVEFLCVPLGRTFRAGVGLPDSPVWHSRTGPGPRTTGSKAVIEVECEFGTKLSGRVLDADGAPVSKGRLTFFTVDQDGDERDQKLLAAEADGRFEFHAYLRPGVEWLSIRQANERGGPLASGRTSLRGAFGLDGRRAPAFDVGDVRLEALPLIASGIVLDGHGAPAAGASVTVRALRLEANSRGEASVDWDFLWDTRTRADGQGQFELRGVADAQTVALYSRKGEAWAGPLAVPSGSQGVELRLEAAGSVSGRVLAHAPLQAQALRIVLDRTDAAGPDAPPREDAQSTGIDRDGRFTLRFVPAGVWNATVEVIAGGHDLATIEGLVVRAGEPAADPRLLKIEVRQPGIVLRCVDERGRRVLDLSAQLRGAATPDDDFEWLRGNHGELLLPESALPADLWIESDGFLSVRLKSVTESRVVELRRAPRIRLEYTTSAPLPEHVYWLILSRGDSPEATGGSAWLPVDLSGRREWPVPFEGRAALELRVGATLEDSVIEVDVEVEPPSIQLDARAPVQDVKVRLDAERIRAAIEAELRRNADPSDEPDEGEDGR